MSETINKIYEVIVSQLPSIERSDFNMDTKIKEDLGLDSLKLVVVLTKLEESLNFVFEESDLNIDELLIVGDLVKLVEKASNK